MTLHANKVGYDIQLYPNLWWSEFALSTLKEVGELKMKYVRRDASKRDQEAFSFFFFFFQSSAIAKVNWTDLGAVGKWLGCFLSPDLKLHYWAGCEELLIVIWWICHTAMLIKTTNSIMRKSWISQGTGELLEKWTGFAHSWGGSTGNLLESKIL